jgi:hypothetical protein
LEDLWNPSWADAEKDGLAVGPTLSIAQYETKSLGFTRSYRLRLVSGF